MIDTRSWHWPFALALAMLLHLAAYLGLASGAGTPPVFRGGGSFGASGDRPVAEIGLLVALRAKGEAPAAAPATPAAPRSETADPAAPGPATEQAAKEAVELAPQGRPDSPPEEVAALEPNLLEPLEKPLEVEAIPTAPPLPGRKPKAPAPQPELGLLEERLPLLGPAPEQPVAKSPDVPASTPGAAAAGGETAELLHVAGEGAVGTAGLDSEGAVPKLNYKEQVLLWLKRHGGYPEGSYRFRQEGVVLLHFAVDRKGRVLYYNIRKSSGYYLLDEAVKTMMNRASPVPPIPPEIALDKLEFTVPVRFTRS